MQINKISEGDFSTLGGMNGGTPESPDGSRIVYARKKDLTRSEGTEIWVCGSDGRNHRHIFTVSCMNHNGPSATFINNHDIVFRDLKDGLPVFRIVNIDTGEVKHKICAKESHRAENGLYPFSVSGEFAGKNPSYPEIDRNGIYILDTASGKISLAASEEDILNIVRSAGFTPTEHTAAVSHVQLNPDASSVMMRLGVKECPVFGALGAIDFESGKTHLIPDKPVHQLWYDNDTYMAARQLFVNGRIEAETSYLARFAKDGEELEVLGGIGNHMDADPERKLFAADRCYPGYSPNVYLYEKGSKKPAEVFEIGDFQDIVWKKQVHPNPSFSRDGRRLYFNRPVSDDKTEYVYIKIR